MIRLIAAIALSIATTGAQASALWPLSDALPLTDCSQPISKLSLDQIEWCQTLAKARANAQRRQQQDEGVTILHGSEPKQ